MPWEIHDHLVTLETREQELDRKELDRFLADGWEPYAVTKYPHSNWTYHLRREYFEHDCPACTGSPAVAACPVCNGRGKVRG